MKHKNHKPYGALSLLLFLLFFVFTILVSVVDTAPIGPEQSVVGLSTINHAVFHRLGTHWIWYPITDWLGSVAILFAFGFALIGLYQWIRHKSIRRVDPSILAMGGVYLLMLTVYLLFERIVINYRPVLLDGCLEASYPSSHTMLVTCIMATAAIWLHSRAPHKRLLCRCVDLFSGLVITFTAVGRLLSGVHWFTDVLGSLLLSAALVSLYLTLERFICEHLCTQQKEKRARP